MVTYRKHGGNCCGAGHLHGFGYNEEQDPNLILTAQREAPRQRMTEVILNGTQVAQKPRTLRHLADIGYVLVGHYINGNHNSHNYVFHRCDARLPLVNPDGTCVIPNWNGPVITPGLTGNLGALPGNVRGNGRVGYVRPLPTGQFRSSSGVIHGLNTRRAFQTGDRVRIQGSASRRNGLEFVVEGYLDGYVFMRDHDGRFEIASHRCINLTPPAEVPASRPLEVGSRVQYIENGARPRGSCGTVTGLAETAARVQWDNPDDGSHNGGTSNRALYVSDPAINTLIVAPAVPEFVPTRHAPAPDWDGLRFAGVMAEVAPPAPVQPPAPAVVFRTFHNVFADGRRGAGYDTYEEAFASRGRRTLIDRRAILSDGTVNWVTSVTN